MPIYSYECTECNERFDALQPMAARHTALCPNCDGLGKQKLTTVAIDYLGMGLDPRGSPTAADKWAKMHEQKGSKRGQR
jgi:putative FmdB family regulatory protein